MNKRRIGKFTVSFELFERDTEEFQQIMSNMRVIEATNHFHNHSIEYTAVCELFDYVEYGSLIPVYELIFEVRKDRLPQLTFEVERIEN